MLIELSEHDFNDIWHGYLSIPLPTECKLGDEIVFQINKRPVARAIVGRIERFEGHRVFWQPHTFEEVEQSMTSESAYSAEPVSAD